MKDKIFGVLQRVGRSFMLPIAILPVAGLLLGFGGSFTNETMLETYGLLNVMGPGTIPYAIFQVMSEAGNIVFANLPIIFAMGVAIGMAKKEKRSCGSLCCHRIFHYARFYQCDDHHQRWNRKHAGRCNYVCCRHHISSDGCIRRYHRRTRCFFAAQPFLQNRTATGIIVLRWNKIRTNYLFACIYRRWYPDVLYLASHPDRDLRTWRSCT